MLKTFIEIVKSENDVYERALRHRDAEYPGMRAKDYLVLKFIQMRLNTGTSLKETAQDIPVYYKQLLKQVYSKHLKKKVVINWDAVDLPICVAEGQGVSEDLLEYQQLYFPVRSK